MGLVALSFELAHESGHALVDESLDLGFGDVGQLEPEDIAGLGEDGREVAEEENGMQDSCREAESVLLLFPSPDFPWRRHPGEGGALKRIRVERAPGPNKKLKGQGLGLTAHDIAHRTGVCESFKYELGCAALVHREIRVE